jgi:hypothetical protein
VVAYLPFNVSHCSAPLLFVWAVPSLSKGSSIIVALVPVSARPFLGSLLHFYHGLIRLFQRYVSGLWEAHCSLRVQRLKGVTVVTIVTVTLTHVLVVLGFIADTVHIILAIVRFHAVLFTAFLGISH